MKIMLKRLVLLLIIAGAAYMLWDQRHKIASLQNNKLRIQGTWYQVELEWKGRTPYHFSERINTANDSEWGSYEMPKNTVIEVMTADKLTVYQLSFSDDGDMIWSMEVDGKMTEIIRWRE